MSASVGTPAFTSSGSLEGGNGNDQLLGGPGSRPAAVDGLAARTLVKGEALAPPAGRADDFAWPRREVGREQARGIERRPPILNKLSALHVIVKFVVFRIKLAPGDKEIELTAIEGAFDCG